MTSTAHTGPETPAPAEETAAGTERTSVTGAAAPASAVEQRLAELGL
ncbi:endoribonuclease L-PSP, partial [Arthrobacter sp. Hiyo6]